MLFSLMLMASFSFAEVDQKKIHTPTPSTQPIPSLETGAKVFSQSCVLCHGPQGMGEGLLALKIKDYPSTNLATSLTSKTKDEIFKAIAYGGLLEEYSDYMPPFGASLSWVEIESVSMFIEKLRKEPEAASKMISVNLQQGKESVNLAKLGPQVYSTRCVLCHGKYGEGDGRMSKVIKNPPPFDLTASRMPDEYLRQIINKGGEAMGRSKQMPPWGDQLSDTEVNAVILHLKSIRD